MATARLVGGHPRTLVLTAPDDVEQNEIVDFGNASFVAGSAAASGERCQFAVGGGIYEVTGDPTVGSPGYYEDDAIGEFGNHFGLVLSKDGTNCRIDHQPNGSVEVDEG